MNKLFPFLALALMGCAELGLTPVAQPRPDAVTSDPSVPPPPPPEARSVEQFDTTTEAQRAAAAQPSGGGQALGSTVATLGDPSKPGFWIETSLVSEVGTGRITSVATGNSVEVELRPVGTGSARVSLAAWRLLEVPLTDLAEVEVFAG